MRKTALLKFFCCRALDESREGTRQPKRTSPRHTNLSIVRLDARRRRNASYAHRDWEVGRLARAGILFGLLHSYIRTPSAPDSSPTFSTLRTATLVVTKQFCSHIFSTFALTSPTARQNKPMNSFFIQNLLIHRHGPITEIKNNRHEPNIIQFSDLHRVRQTPKHHTIPR